MDYYPNFDNRIQLYMVSYALHLTKNKEFRLKIREYYRDFNEKYKKYNSFGDELVQRVGFDNLRECAISGIDCVWKCCEIAGVPSTELVNLLTNDSVCKALFAAQVAWLCANPSDKDDIACSVLTGKPPKFSFMHLTTIVELLNSHGIILNPFEGVTDMLHILHIQNEELYQRHTLDGIVNIFKTSFEECVLEMNEKQVCSTLICRTFPTTYSLQ